MSPASTPAALRVADVSILGKVKCLVIRALQAHNHTLQNSASTP